MTRLDQSLAIPKNLQDYLQDRDRVHELVTQGYRLLREAEKAARASGLHGISGNSTPRDSLEHALQEVDRSFWRRAFDVTGFNQVMDAEAKRRFHDDVSGPKCPEFTEDNVRETFGYLIHGAQAMFERGIVNMFARLSGNYRSNHAFRIDRRLVMRYMVRPRFLKGGLEVNFDRAADEINDMDRVLRVLDGKEHEPRALEAAMNQAFIEPPCEYEDEYLKVRAFKNGNLHVWILRDDLIEQINRIIARHYGETLGKERSAA